MTKRIALITLIVALAALVALPLLARPFARAHATFGGHHGPEGFGRHFLAHLDDMADELDLSSAQIDQLKTIARETHEENATYRQQLKGGIHEVVTTLLTNPNDTAAAQAILDKQAAAENAMKRNILAATSEALNVLTPAQRTRLAQLIGEHRARRMARR